MLPLVSTACALTVSVILFLAVAEHLASPSSLRAALVSQAILPPGLAWLATGATMVIEAAIAIAAGAGVIAGDHGRTMLWPALAVGTMLFGLYAVYTAILATRRKGVRCGCSRRDIVVDGWVVARALACLVVAAVALSWSDQTIAVFESEARFAIAVLVALTFAVLLWHAPLALQDPVRQVLREGRSQVRALGRKEYMT